MGKGESAAYQQLLLFPSCFKPFPKRQILDSSKLKEFQDDNYILDDNGRKFSKRVENTVGTGEISPFSHSVFKRLVLQTRKNLGLFGKRLVFTKQQISISSKLTELADDKFKFDGNGRKLSQRVENTCGKRSNSSFRASFSHSLFKRLSLVVQTSKNQGLFGKGLKCLPPYNQLTHYHTTNFRLF